MKYYLITIANLAVVEVAFLITVGVEESYVYSLFNLAFIVCFSWNIIGLFVIRIILLKAVKVRYKQKNWVQFNDVVSLVCGRKVKIYQCQDERRYIFFVGRKCMILSSALCDEICEKGHKQIISVIKKSIPKRYQSIGIRIALFSSFTLYLTSFFIVVFNILVSVIFIGVIILVVLIVTGGFYEEDGEKIQAEISAGYYLAKFFLLINSIIGYIPSKSVDYLIENLKKISTELLKQEGSIVQINN